MIPKYSQEIIPKSISIGNNAKIDSFDEAFFKGVIDPVVMVDHFYMMGQTFPTHPHAGMSAVSYLFEDSKGGFISYDSMGHAVPVEAGGLHWFLAGKGALHNEMPQGVEPRIHGLQVFVNLPRVDKFCDPAIFHIAAQDIPVYLADKARVRVVAGAFAGIQSPLSLPRAFRVLDVQLQAKALFELDLTQNWGHFLYVVRGHVHVSYEGDVLDISQGHARGFAPGYADALLHITVQRDTQWVLLAGPQIQEPILKSGPFVMNSYEDIEQVWGAFKTGKMGTVNLPSQLP